MGSAILMIATDAHGGFGGIAQYNRDVLRAFSQIEEVTQVSVVPRLIPEEMGELPPKVTYSQASTRSKWHFAWVSLTRSLVSKPDLIYCAHVNLLPVARLCQLISGAPIILAIYGIDVWKPLPTRHKEIIEKHVSIVLSISRVTSDRLQEWCDVETEKIAICPNAIDLERYAMSSAFQTAPSILQNITSPILMTMGRMVGEDRAKGFDEVLNLLPSLLHSYPELSYVMVGDGPDKARLMQKAKTLGVADRVVFAGRIDEDDKIPTLSRADCYVMPSKGEGFGFVVLEALACGVPVVASAVDGTREAVRHGQLGELVDPDSPEDITTGISSALSQERGILPGLAYFDFPRFTDRLSAIINRSLNPV